MRPSQQMKRISVSKSPTFTGQVRDVFHEATPAQGRHLATRLIQSLPACPIPEIARLGRTLRKWKDALDAYFDTAGASNAPHRSHQRPPRTPTRLRPRVSKPHQLHHPSTPRNRRIQTPPTPPIMKSRETVRRALLASSHARCQTYLGPGPLKRAVGWSFPRVRSTMPVSSRGPRWRRSW